jgi:hypothetical protein
MSRGRTPPPRPIDHKAALRERLGRAAYHEWQTQSGQLPAWEQLTEGEREQWRTIGQAVMDQIVRRDPRRGEISTEGIISAQTGQPYVQLAIDISPTQLTPGKAREVALMLLEAADAAESDAVLNRFAREQIGLDELGAAQLIAQFRKSREQARGTEASSA